MAGHSTILAWPREQYEAVVDGLNAAFTRRAASLYYNTHVTAHLIEVFNPSESGLDEDLWKQIKDSVRHFDQLLIYAFESAPDRVVRKWAEDHVEGSGDEAIYRIEYLRRNAPAIAKQWLSRATTVNYALGDLQADIVINPAAESLAVLLRLDVFVPGPAPKRSPISNSRQWTSFVADANELERLIAKLRRYQSLIVSGEGAMDADTDDIRGLILDDKSEETSDDVT